MVRILNHKMLPVVGVLTAAILLAMPLASPVREAYADDADLVVVNDFEGINFCDKGAICKITASQSAYAKSVGSDGKAVAVNKMKSINDCTKGSKCFIHGKQSTKILKIN